MNNRKEKRGYRKQRWKSIVILRSGIFYVSLINGGGEEGARDSSQMTEACLSSD